jgi:hypothetical protein
MMLKEKREECFKTATEENKRRRPLIEQNITVGLHVCGGELRFY